MARITLWNATAAAAEATVSTAGYEEITVAVVTASNLNTAITIKIDEDAYFVGGAAATLTALIPQRTLPGGPTYTFTMATPTGAVGLDMYASGAHGMP